MTTCNVLLRSALEFDSGFDNIKDFEVLADELRAAIAESFGISPEYITIDEISAFETHRRVLLDGSTPDVGRNDGFRVKYTILAFDIVHQSLPSSTDTASIRGRLGRSNFTGIQQLVAVPLSAGNLTSPKCRPVQE